MFLLYKVNETWVLLYQGLNMTDWLSRWENNNIGWHADEVNLQLIERLSELNLVTGDKDIFTSMRKEQRYDLSSW